MPGYSIDGGGYVEVDPAGDCFMAARDARFILDHLSRWSAHHGNTWCLESEGGEIGTIADGQIDAELLNLINEALLLGSEDPDLAMMEMDAMGTDDEERVMRIDEKYSSRWE